MALNKIKILIIGFLLFGSLGWANTDRVAVLELKKILEIGNRDFMFYSIESLCEDDKGNFYVLDAKAYKVHKFSPFRTLLLSFGNRGEGPGDMMMPHYICMTPNNTIAVCEHSSFVSFFDTNGKFLERIRLANGSSLRFISDNLYYGWVWKTKSIQQVLLDKTGKILKSLFEVSTDSFSVSMPDESGRMVMSNFYTEEYTPALLVSIYKQHAIIGVGNIYTIYNVDSKNLQITRIKRDIKPFTIKPGEVTYFKNQVNSRRNFHPAVKKKFIKNIPNYKNYFNHLLISGKYIFVFRIKEDILDENILIPVDIIDIQGKYKGTARLKKLPIFISDNYVYFSEELEDGTLLVGKYSFTVK